MRKICLSVLLLILMNQAAAAADFKLPVPTPGMITMVEVGANKCIPCKMMAPIIAELKKEYAGRVSIVFLDVWESKDAVAFARQARVQGIPTQIYYDKNGTEFFRHGGYMDKKGIVEILARLGATPVTSKKK